MRGDPDFELLATIPGDRITGVQLCDATAEVPFGVPPAYDGLNNRRAPGDGDFPVRRIIEALRAIGGLNNVGLEIFSPVFDAMPADAIGERSRRLLDAYLG